LEISRLRIEEFLEQAQSVGRVAAIMIVGESVDTNFAFENIPASFHP
jgi:hypothetical protein